MSILKQLQNNKGAVSSALGKLLAEKTLKGDLSILKEAVSLVNSNDKNIRAGAAKIIEKVAEKRPELVAPYLKNLLPALDVPEAQTRWMIIYTFGYCAKENLSVASKALKKADLFLKENSGACLWDRTILYLGYLGAVSEKQAKQVFPLLEKALTAIPGQAKTVLESFERMLPVLTDQIKNKLSKHVQKYLANSKASVKSKALRLQEKLQ